MARRRRQSLALSGEHARQALGVLIHDGKLAAGDVQNALKRHRHLVTDLRARLTALEQGVGTAARKVGRKVRSVKRAVARRKPKLSAATRKLYQQQGRYMAAVRQLAKADRAKIKAIREKSGVRAAVAAAKRMAK